MHKGFEKKMLLCLVLGAALAAGLNLIIAMLPLDKFFPTYSTEVKPWLFRFPLHTGLILYGIVTPVIEELIFRLLFFKRLCVYVTAEAAGAASAVIFGLYHGNAVQFVYAFIFGLFLAYVYWRFDNILAAMFLHSAANSYVYILYFLPVAALFNNNLFRFLIVLLSGLVSLLIMMYFLNTAPKKSTQPIKPFFPRR